MEVGSEQYEVGKSVTIGERSETGRTSCTIDTEMIREEMAYQPECENKPPQQKTAAAVSLRRTAMQGGDAAKESNSQKHTTLQSWLAQLFCSGLLLWGLVGAGAAHEL